MKYAEMCSLLKQYGWQFLRHGRGTHELWQHPITKQTLLVTRSGLANRARQNWIAQLKRRSENFA